jgi:hypothetical protein
MVAAVLDADIRPPGRKLVAVVFAESAREDGTRAFPGASRLGVRTGMAPATTREHVRHLIEIDRVLIEVRRAQTNQRRELRFDLGRLAELTGASVPAAVAGTGSPTAAGTPANRCRPASEQAPAHQRPSVLPRPTSSIEPERAPSATRRRDPIFDALVEACGLNYAEMPDRERRACGVAAAELSRLEPTRSRCARLPARRLRREV